MVQYGDETADQFMANIICVGIISLLVSVVACVTCPGEGLIGIGIGTVISGMSFATKTGETAYIVIGTSGLIWISAGRRKIESRNIELRNAVMAYDVTVLSSNVDPVTNSTDPIDTEANENESESSEVIIVSIVTEPDEDESDFNEIEPQRNEMLTKVNECNGQFIEISKVRDEEEVQQNHNNANTVSQDVLESGLQLHQQEHTKISSWDIQQNEPESESFVSSAVPVVAEPNTGFKARAVMKLKSKMQNDRCNGEYKILSQTMCNGGQHRLHSENNIDSQDALEQGVELSHLNRQKDQDHCNLCSQKIEIPAAEDRDPDSSLKRGLILFDNFNGKDDDNQRDITESSSLSHQNSDSIGRNQISLQEENITNIDAEYDASVS